MRRYLIALAALVGLGAFATSASAQVVVDYLPPPASHVTYYDYGWLPPTYVPAYPPVVTYYRSPVIVSRPYVYSPPVVVRRPVIVTRPRVYVRGQPIRNTLRFLAP
jgi:hypothetical protein